MHEEYPGDADREAVINDELIEQFVFTTYEPAFQALAHRHEFDLGEERRRIDVIPHGFSNETTVISDDRNYHYGIEVSWDVGREGYSYVMWRTENDKMMFSDVDSSLQEFLYRQLFDDEMDDTWCPDIYERAIRTEYCLNEWDAQFTKKIIDSHSVDATEVVNMSLGGHTNDDSYVEADENNDHGAWRMEMEEYVATVTLDDLRIIEECLYRLGLPGGRLVMELPISLTD